MVPVESGKFCFRLSPDVSLDFISGNIGTLGKTKRTVSLGTVHKCMLCGSWFWGKSLFQIIPVNDNNNFINIVIFSGVFIIIKISSCFFQVCSC